MLTRILSRRTRLFRRTFMLEQLVVGDHPENAATPIGIAYLPVVVHVTNTVAKGSHALLAAGGLI